MEGFPQDGARCSCGWRLTILFCEGGAGGDGCGVAGCRGVAAETLRDGLDAVHRHDTVDAALNRWGLFSSRQTRWDSLFAPPAKCAGVT